MIRPMTSKANADEREMQEAQGWQSPTLERQIPVSAKRNKHISWEKEKSGEKQKGVPSSHLPASFQVAKESRASKVLICCPTCNLRENMDSKHTNPSLAVRRKNASVYTLPSRCGYGVSDAVKVCACVRACVRVWCDGVQLTV